MDKQAVQNQFESFFEEYKRRILSSQYSKEDLLNFYLQGRIDANNDLIKKFTP